MKSKAYLTYFGLLLCCDILVVRVFNMLVQQLLVMQIAQIFLYLFHGVKYCSVNHRFKSNQVYLMPHIYLDIWICIVSYDAVELISPY